MGILSHYRDNAPNWGSEDVSFSHPPPLSYSPRSHWSGIHHYMAHAVDPHPDLYDHAIDHSQSGSGASMHEARHWHRLTYGGIKSLKDRAPTELGHAAAYEALRYVLHHPQIRDATREHDHGRFRETLVSLAIAEASRLWAEKRRREGHQGLDAATAAAAATAALLASQHRDISQLGPERLHSLLGGGERGQGRSNAYALDDEALLGRREGSDASRWDDADDFARRGRGRDGHGRRWGADSNRSRSRSGSFSPRMSRSEERGYGGGFRDDNSYHNGRGNSKIRGYSGYAGSPQPPASFHISSGGSPSASGGVPNMAGVGSSSPRPVARQGSRSPYSGSAQGYGQQGYGQPGYAYAQPGYAGGQPQYAGSQPGYAVGQPVQAGYAGGQPVQTGYSYGQPHAQTASPYTHAQAGYPYVLSAPQYAHGGGYYGAPVHAQGAAVPGAPGQPTVILVPTPKHRSSRRHRDRHRHRRDGGYGSDYY